MYEIHGLLIRHLWRLLVKKKGGGVKTVYVKIGRTATSIGTGRNWRIDSTKLVVAGARLLHGCSEIRVAGCGHLVGVEGGRGAQASAGNLTW